MSEKWTPRLAPGQSLPTTINEWFALACSSVYADSGIQGHLPYLGSIVRPGDRIVELGTGGGDQSTVAWLAARPARLDTYDQNKPGSLVQLHAMAIDAGVEFLFHHGPTQTADPRECDILFIDTLHDRATVEAELTRFAPKCRRDILFHDVVSFGESGQFAGPDQGINLAIARFLFRNPSWRVAYYSEADNGLLHLTINKGD